MISVELAMQDLPCFFSSQVNKLLQYSEQNDKVLYFPGKPVPIALEKKRN